MRFFLLFGLLCSLWSCGSLSHFSSYDDSSTSNRVARALFSALDSHATWVPAVGAVAFSIGNLDQRTSDWAVEHRPIFGSQKKAVEYSGYLLDTTRVFSYGSLYFVPKRETGHGFLKRLLVHEVAVRGSAEVTDMLKRQVKRTRPNGSDQLSFPSGHATRAFAAANMFRHNIYDNPSSGGLSKTLWSTWGYFLAGSVGWARIEAGKHYPSDVLAAAALANFLGTFLHDVFLLPKHQNFALQLGPLDDGMFFNVDWQH